MTARVPLYGFLASAALLAVYGAAQSTAQAQAGNSLKDVQVGEKGRLMRVALICTAQCGVGARSGGVFHLQGVDADLTIDLKGRSAIARSLHFSPVGGGADLSIKADALMTNAAVRRCAIDGADATCIDLEFAPPGVTAARVGTPKAAPVVPARPTQTLEARPGGEALPAPRLEPASLDESGRSLLVLAQIAPPERIDPPPGAAQKLLQPKQAPAKTPPPAPRTAPAAPTLAAVVTPGERRPIIRTDRAAALLGPEIDILKESARILGRPFGVAQCEAAQARLRADAWALDAMVDVGFCTAARGALEDADGMFIRLLKYTPDNYEALVGRALIAAKSGERSIARKYFQDALNVPPPIEESNRIVAALGAL